MLENRPVVTTGRPDGTASHEGSIRVLDPTGHVILAKAFIDPIEVMETGCALGRDCLRGDRSGAPVLRPPWRAATEERAST